MGQMERIGRAALFAVVVLLVSVAGAKPARAQDGLQKVNHIIVVMQENHSFDNYFGALAYAPGSPYRSPDSSHGCREGDHS